MIKYLEIFLTRMRQRLMSRQKIFARIYERNLWKEPESRSGSGSTLAATERLREILPNIIAENNIESVLDIPCGDMNWMNHLDLPVSYIGADIVPDIVKRNQQLHGNHLRSFQVLDVVQDQLPRADLVICRDLFLHLRLKEISESLRNIKASGATWLLASTYTTITENSEGVTGSWRFVNLQIAPFHFPAPQRMIHEEDRSEARRSPKSAGLWKLSDLRV